MNTQSILRKPKPPRLRKARGRHLTYHDRHIIETWYNHNLQQPRKKRMSLTAMAEYFGICRQTLWREIRRGTLTQPNWHKDKPVYEYSAHVAQNKLHKSWLNKGPPQRMTNRTAEDLRKEIVERKLSPAHALYNLRKMYPKRYLPCVSTVYNHIHDQSLGITWRSLPYRLNPRRRPKQHDRNDYRIIRGNTSIEQRPVEIAMRETFGHWEMDLLVCKKRTAVLAMIERKTREVVLEKVKDKKQATIERALKRMLKSGEISYLVTITTDNGSEFINSEHLKRALRCATLKEVYYCHPQSPQEKGSVENGNRHVRRWFPKGTDFTQVTRKQLKETQNTINSIPRPVLINTTAHDAYLLEARLLQKKLPEM